MADMICPKAKGGDMREKIEQEVEKAMCGMCASCNCVEKLKQGGKGCPNFVIACNRFEALFTAELQAMREALLNEVADNDELLEVGRKAIEDELIEWRDNRLSMFNRGNGLVVREKDGKDSSVIRFGPETALKIGLKAIALKGGR